MESVYPDQPVPNAEEQPASPAEHPSRIRLPEPDADNITVLTEELPNDPILPWHRYDSPWLEAEPLPEEATSLAMGQPEMDHTQSQASLPAVQVIGSIYQGANQAGDFRWMIEQADYEDVLFIFNDNEEQFRAHQQAPDSVLGCAAGGGNAVIRPYQCQSPPRAAGIPTGADGQGYASLTPRTQQVIDEAIAVIRSLIATGRYCRIFYSAASSGKGLGTGIFQVGEEVKTYIVEQLQRLS